MEEKEAERSKGVLLRLFIVKNTAVYIDFIDRSRIDFRRFRENMGFGDQGM